MIRTKVINDSADLVSIIRAFDTSTKKEVFNEILKDWTPTSVIIEKFGRKGQAALEFFDKMKLAETKWTTPEEGIDGRPQKMYRSFYSLFNINISCPVNEISDIFTISALNDENFKAKIAVTPSGISEPEKKVEGTLVGMVKKVNIATNEVIVGSGKIANMVNIRGKCLLLK